MGNLGKPVFSLFFNYSLFSPSHLLLAPCSLCVVCVVVNIVVVPPGDTKSSKIQTVWLRLQGRRGWGAPRQGALFEL